MGLVGFAVGHGRLSCGLHWRRCRFLQDMDVEQGKNQDLGY